MRVSLYKHELEIVATLTVSLMKLAMTDREVGIDYAATLFGDLTDALYSRGQWKTEYGRPISEIRDWHIDTAEVVP